VEDWYDGPPPRPVWLAPAIFAALGIVIVVLIAVVHRHDDRSDTAATTTTTAVHASTTTTRPRSGPLGGPGNPIPVGGSGTVGGWTLGVLSPTDADGTVLASVRIVWNGTAGQTIGDAKQLSLQVLDQDGNAHDLGGAGCPGDPAGALAAVPGLDVGTSDTLALCWSVPHVDRDTSMLVVQVAAAPTPLYFALR
jgi:hypothetical protein